MSNFSHPSTSEIEYQTNVAGCVHLSKGTSPRHIKGGVTERGWRCCTEHVQQVGLLVALVARVEHLLHVAVHRSRDVVHVLGLDDRFQVVLQDAGKVVLQLRSAEIREDVLPVRGCLQHTSATTKGSNPRACKGARFYSECRVGLRNLGWAAQ